MPSWTCYFWMIIHEPFKLGIFDVPVHLSGSLDGIGC